MQQRTFFTDKNIQTYSSMTDDVLLSEKHIAQLQTRIIELKHDIVHVINNLKSLQKEKSTIKEDII